MGEKHKIVIKQTARAHTTHQSAREVCSRAPLALYGAGGRPRAGGRAPRTTTRRGVATPEGTPPTGTPRREAGGRGTAPPPPRRTPRKHKAKERHARCLFVFLFGGRWAFFFRNPIGSPRGVFPRPFCPHFFVHALRISLFRPPAIFITL